MKKVLFVCIHNSARSQVAQELLRKYGGEEFVVESAGFENDKGINPLAIAVLQEEGIDIAGKKTNNIFDFFKEGRRYNYVITVCDQAKAQKCPLFPGMTMRLNWDFEDPSEFSGDQNEQMKKMQEVKEKIKSEVLHFIDLVKSKKLKDNAPKEWLLQ